MQPRKQEHEGFYELLVYKRLWLLVREGGFEPPYLGCWILSPVRLPVPPLSQRYINSLFAGGPQAAPSASWKAKPVRHGCVTPQFPQRNSKASVEALRPPRGPGLRRSPACPAPAPASPAARPAANRPKSGRQKSRSQEPHPRPAPPGWNRPSACGSDGCPPESVRHARIPAHGAKGAEPPYPEPRRHLRPGPFPGHGRPGRNR